MATEWTLVRVCELELGLLREKSKRNRSSIILQLPWHWQFLGFPTYGVYHTYSNHGDVIVV